MEGVGAIRHAPPSPLIASKASIRRMFELEQPGHAGPSLTLRPLEELGVEGVGWSGSRWTVPLHGVFHAIFLRTSLWTAAGLMSLVAFVQHMLGLPDRWHPPALVFFSALLIYNLDHLLDARREGAGEVGAPTPQGEARRRELAWHRGSFAQALVLVSGAVAAVLAAMAPASAQVVFVGYGSVGVLYSIPLVPMRTRGRWGLVAVKEVPGFKGFVVTLALVAGVLVLPVVWAGAAFDIRFMLLGAFLFCFIFSNAQMFDVRDVLEDTSRGVPTLPCTVGVRRTRHGLLLLNLLVLAGLAWSWSGGTVAPHPEVVVSMAATIAYLLIFDVDLHRDLYAVGIDGCLFVPAIVMLCHVGP